MENKCQCVPGYCDVIGQLEQQSRAARRSLENPNSITKWTPTLWEKLAIRIREYNAERCREPSDDIDAQIDKYNPFDENGNLKPLEPVQK